MTVDEHEPAVWAVTGQEGEDATLVTPTDPNVGRQIWDMMRRSGEALYREAPFPLYGLPATWRGIRGLGGREWGTSPTGHEVANALSLVHYIDVNRDGPSLAVETAAPDPSRGGSGLRCIAGWLWFGGARTVEEAQEADREWWDEPPTPADELVRREVTLRIEGRAVSFHSLWREAEWVAYAEVDGYHITVEGSDFDPEEVDLVRVLDVEPYIEGGP